MTKQSKDLEQDTTPQQSPDIRTVELDVPIMCGGREIKSVTLRRPNSGAMRGLSLSDIANIDVNSLQRLLPRITEPILTTADVAALDLADLTTIGVEVAGFLAKKKDRQAYQ